LLNGEDFERYLEILFKKLGYQVRRTPYQGDYGADLILRRGDEDISVQAKRYNRAVGVKAVQEAVTAKDYYGCNKAMVVTNSYFSRQARTLAKANSVELWDRNELVNRLLALKEEKPTSTPVISAIVSTKELSPAPADGSFPICAQCGKPVSAKVRDYCMENQSTFGGLIYCYDHQKEARRTPRLR
jgi:restriction system protein